jgi:multisubunit Na+/H+ antiporter MnhF subunit
MWTVAATAVLVCLLGPFIRCVRGDAVSRLVALEAASSMAVVILLLLCEAYHRVPFVDLALALALLSFGGGLAFARFPEWWL